MNDARRLRAGAGASCTLALCASPMAARPNDGERSDRLDPLVDPVPEVGKTIEEGRHFAIHRIGNRSAIQRKKPDAAHRERHPLEDRAAMLFLHAQDEIRPPNQCRIDALAAVRGKIPQPRGTNDVNCTGMRRLPRQGERTRGERPNRREPGSKHGLRHRTATHVCRADEQNRESRIRTSGIDQVASTETLKSLADEFYIDLRGLGLLILGANRRAIRTPDDPPGRIVLPDATPEHGVPERRPRAARAAPAKRSTTNRRSPQHRRPRAPP